MFSRTEKTLDIEKMFFYGVDKSVIYRTDFLKGISGKINVVAYNDYWNLYGTH